MVKAPVTYISFVTCPFFSRAQQLRTNLQRGLWDTAEHFEMHVRTMTSRIDLLFTSLVPRSFSLCAVFFICDVMQYTRVSA